eukprot:1648489-Amphidinium_carterae.1
MHCCGERIATLAKKDQSLNHNTTNFHTCQTSQSSPRMQSSKDRSLHVKAPYLLARAGSPQKTLKNGARACECACA